MMPFAVSFSTVLLIANTLTLSSVFIAIRS